MIVAEVAPEADPSFAPGFLLARCAAAANCKRASRISSA